MTKQISLGKPILPEFGLPTDEPIVPSYEYKERIKRTKDMMMNRGLQFLVVYGDREHFSNLEFLTGFDPRFEEAILILTSSDVPTLVVGHECIGYSQIASIELKRRLWQSFSLLGMPRNENQSFEDIIREAGIDAGSTGGVVGWKYFQESELPNAKEAFETPAFLIETLRRVIKTGKLVNSTDMFMDPEGGLRTSNSIDQLAKFEFAATYASQAVRNVIFHLSPGITEYQASQELHLPAMPLSCHIMLSSGQRAFLGLPSPSDRLIERGDPFTVAVGLRGGLSARAGFVVEDARQLEPAIRDYSEKLVGPYFAAIAEWYETVGIGVTGGELYEVIHKYIGAPFFGVKLTPGHLTHTEEWIHSPMFKGSNIGLKAGMAIQVDVIPGTGTPYFTTNIEDPIILANRDMQEELASRYPETWERIRTRKAFMREGLGIRLKDDVLPCSNIPGYLPPYLLNPSCAMVVNSENI